MNDQTITNFNILSPDLLSDRSALAKSFKANPKPFMDECQGKKTSLAHLFNKFAPEPTTSSMPKEALFEVCGHLDLYPSDNDDQASSTVGDFFNAGAAGINLFWGVLDHDYNETLGINQLLATTASETDLVPGSGFSPRAQLPMVNTQQMSPRFRITDLTPRVQTVTDLSYEQTQFQGPTNAADYVMKPVAPNAKIPTTTTIVGSRFGNLKKIGEGLKMDDNLTGNQMFMTAVRMQVELIALRTEQAIVNNGVKILFDSIGSAPTDFELLQANPDMADVIKVNLESGTNNAYMYNLLIFRQSEAEKWIEANIQNGQNLIFSNLPEGRFSEVFNSIRVINNVSGATSIAFVGDSEIEGWGPANERFLGVDQRFALIYVRRGSGFRDDSDTDIETQTRRRFLTQFFDWWLVIPAAVKGWRLS